MSEAEALGTVAATYEDLRRVLGLPIVNLIYRHFAATPGLLEGLWAELRPNLLSTYAESAAAELAEVGAPGGLPIPHAALTAVGVGPEELEAAAATLDAYRRANSRNLLAMRALIAGAAGAGGGAEARPPRPSRILPMADLRDVAPQARALLHEMSVPITGAEEPRIVPSLYRHFAHNPSWLALLWTAVQPGMDELPTHAAGVAARARELACGLPYPVARTDEPTRAVCRRFVGAMSGMLVAGELLRRALS